VEYTAYETPAAGQDYTRKMPSASGVAGSAAGFPAPPWTRGRTFASRTETGRILRGITFAKNEAEARMRLKNLMRAPVEVISPHALLTTAARRLRVKGIHHLVVVDHGVIVGLLTQDVLRNRKAEGATRVEDAMLRNIAIAPPEMTLAEAVALIRPGHLQTAVPVVDNNRLVGIVTASDLLELAARIRRPSPAGATAG
jgi:CBS domain-containing protein